MLQLPEARDAWGSPTFAAVLKKELEALGASVLPLDAAATPGSHVEDAPITVSVLGCAERGGRPGATVAVFFSEVVASCGCGDDPFAQPGYCELHIEIEPATSAATVTLVGV